LKFHSAFLFSKGKRCFTKKKSYEYPNSIANFEKGEGEEFVVEKNVRREA